MKKLLTAALAAAVLMVTLGGAVLAEPRLPSDADAQPDTSYEAGSAPAQTDAWTAMQPAIHALVLAMDENDLDYTPDDPRFQWVALYYMLSLYGQMDDRAELSDAYLTLPGEAVMDLAIPMFPQLTGLPQLPEELADRITYDADGDTYQLSRGDEGLSQVTLTSSYPTGNTGRVITGEMVYLETGKVLHTFRVQLEEDDSMFGFAITGLTLD